jgi:hypothetical protein
MNIPGRKPKPSLLPRLSHAIKKATNEAIRRANLTAAAAAAPKPATRPPPSYQPLPFGLQQRIIEEDESMAAPAAAAAAAPYHRPGLPSPGASADPLRNFRFTGPPPARGMSPLRALAESTYASEQAARNQFGPEAVPRGLAPLTSTPRRNPPPKMYVPGKEVPGTPKGAIINNEGGRRRRKTKRRSHKKRRH